MADAPVTQTPPVVPGSTEQKPPETPAPNTEQKPPEPKPDEMKRHQQLAQRERRLAQQEQELKRVEGELEKRVHALEEFDRVKKSARTNPLEYLKAAGLSYDEIVEYMSSGKPTQDAILAEARAETNRLREEMEAEKKKESEAQAQARKQAEEEAVVKFKADTSQKVKDAGEKYELLNHFGAQHEVANLIEAYYYQSGKLLSFEEAADLCEKELSEQLTKADEVIKKRAERAAKKAEEDKAGKKPEGAAKKPDEKPVTKTLTNEDSSTTSGKSNKGLTPAERKARALARLSGQKLD